MGQFYFGVFGRGWVKIQSALTGSLDQDFGAALNLWDRREPKTNRSLGPEHGPEHNLVFPSSEGCPDSELMISQFVMMTALDEFSTEIEARLERAPPLPGEAPHDARARITRGVAAEWMRLRPGTLLEVLQQLEELRRTP